jgi:hypothetical protein
MVNFQEEVSTQIKRSREQVESFVHDKVNPTVEKATARIKATVDTSTRLDALIAVLVAKGLVSEEELQAYTKRSASPSTAPMVHEEMVPPPPQDQV